MNKVFKKKPPAAEPLSVNSEALDSLTNVAAPQISPGLKKASTSRWKKGKKTAEQKPAFDLAAALPPTDDFRTSLLMPNLSARFSMLREQDDPHSLMGKASDDSVLQPRRKSRMLDFGFAASTLGDIAEVSSIRGSFRPPFADLSRHPSFTSEEGYASDAGGSVMSRSRPGEGNNLFGGRQKIYRIANGADGSSRSVGRAVYEDDIGANAFRRYRQRGHDESQFSRPSDESQGFDFGLEQHEASDHYEHVHFMHNDSAKDLTHSPSLSSYDKKRSTTSSTARSEARSSTAATSIASQPAASPAVAAAPGPGAPHQVPPLERSNTKSRRLYEQGLDQHMREEQTSNLSRLNSIQRQRTNGKASPPFLHNARSVGNLNERSPQPVYALRTQSPPLNGPLTALGSVQKAHSATPSPTPSSPTDLDAQFDLQQALDPSDRGKATAMGAFNKPAQAFDEHQYLERQKQLQRSHSSAANRKPSAPQQRPAGREQERERSGSDASTHSRSQASGRKNDLKSYTVFQNSHVPASAQQKPNRSPLPDTHRTFFGNIHASDSEDDDESSHSFNPSEHGHNGNHSKWQPTVPPVSEHPALRRQRPGPGVAEHAEEYEATSLTSKPSMRSLRSESPRLNDLQAKPTPAPSQPLGNMMHHLRQKSNASSIYPDNDFAVTNSVPDVPDMPANMHYSDPLRRIGHGMEYDSKQGWDLENAGDHSLADGRVSHASVSPIEPSGSGLGLDTIQTPISPLHGELPYARSRRDGALDREDAPSWQQELHRQHNRDVSSATQQERDAFANVLAARRNAIRENIKSVVERDGHSRESSPAPTPVSASGPFKGFGMLRSKASGESISNMREQQLKSAKYANGVPNDRSGFSFERSRSRGGSSPRPPMPPNAQHPAFQQQQAPPSHEHPAHRTLNSSAPRSRSRSNSAATTGRSRSRTGPYRDDLEKAMVEGTGSIAAGHDISPMIVRELTPQASPNPNVGAYDGRTSDEKKSSMTNYFDNKTSPSGMLRTGAAPTGNVFNPNRSMPATSPYSQNATPPLSGSSTPVQNVAAYTPPVIIHRSGTLKKKSVSKADISEPTLMQSSSNMDLVDLPEGASLKNGMDDVNAPPIPPINPRRRGTRNRIFGGRADSADDLTTSSRISSPEPTNDQEYRFPPSSIVRVPRQPKTQQSPGDVDDGLAKGQHRLSDEVDGAPERLQRSQTVGLDGGMF